MQQEKIKDQKEVRRIWTSINELAMQVTKLRDMDFRIALKGQAEAISNLAKEHQYLKKKFMQLEDELVAHKTNLVKHSTQ